MKQNMNLTAKLDCSTNIDSRCHGLRPLKFDIRQIKYYFVQDLHQAARVVLPLMGSIIEAIRYPSPEPCALAIVEGHPTDGTYAILTGLKAELATVGVQYFLSRSLVDLKANGENRIRHYRIFAISRLNPL